MIVREEETAFIMISQHDHAELSGDIARHFACFFEEDAYFEDLVTAVYQHDVGWIGLDDIPVWNDAKAVPFSFLDYPMIPKITHYRYGLDQVERMNRFAGLLCSMHYLSFEVFQNITLEEGKLFIQEEQHRQMRLMKELGIQDCDKVTKHLRLLQLCDLISLYICLFTPERIGGQYSALHKDSFKHSEQFSEDGKTPILAEWLDDEHIKLSNSLLSGSFSLRQKKVRKQLIQEIGIEQAYRQTNEMQQRIVLD